MCLPNSISSLRTKRLKLYCSLRLCLKAVSLFEFVVYPQNGFRAVEYVTMYSCCVIDPTRIHQF